MMKLKKDINDKQKFQVIPAIDIIAGKCVRLTEGDYNSSKEYSNNPLDVALEFADQGFEILHIVDLDGAKVGKPVNIDLINEIIRQTNLKIEVSGGIRNLETAQGYLDIGAWQIILGTIALTNSQILEGILTKLGSDNISVAIDFKSVQNQVNLYTDGWFKTSQDKNSLQNLLELGVKRYIFTDISKDGKLSGSELDNIKSAAGNIPNGNIIVSGGISSIEELKTIKDSGFQGAIIGKALYEGIIKVEELKNNFLN